MSVWNNFVDLYQLKVILSKHGGQVSPFIIAEQSQLSSVTFFLCHTLGSVEYIGNVFNFEGDEARSCHDQFHLRIDLSKHHHERAHIDL